MGSLITANIKSRPTRTVISIVAVGLGVTLMLVIGGITSGTLNDYLSRTVGVGADIMMQPGGASVFYALNGAALQVQLANKLLEVPGVSYVTPVLAKPNLSDFSLVFGIDLASYNQFPGRLKIIEGKESLSGDDAIVDELYARSHNLKPGMPLKVVNHQFTISAICRAGAVVRTFVPLRTLQDLNGTPDKATVIFIKASREVGSKRLMQILQKDFSGYSYLDPSDASLLLADTKMPMFKEFQFIVILVSMMISFMVILLAMYTTIFERTREIGILKSLGASQRFIIGMILRESVMISSLGAVFGLGVSEIIRKIITTAFPTLQVSMTVGDVTRGCLLGLLGGALGALYPAYKAARMDPVKALSYE
jgi:putative ABC transport system permease protein